MLLAPTKSILMMLFAYFAGSIPFGYIIAMVYGGVDVRDHGSGNIGMTNVFRTVGPLPGLITLFLDAFKGWLAVYISLRWIPPAEFGHDFVMWAIIICIIALLAVIGHSFPVWLNFKGGKSVAISLGILAALMKWWVIIPFLVFILVVLISRYISLGSILSAISVPIVFAVFKTYPNPGNTSDSIFIAFTCLLAILVIIRHGSNIKRIISGKENRFGVRAKTITKSDVPVTESQKKDSEKSNPENSS